MQSHQEAHEFITSLGLEDPDQIEGGEALLRYISCLDEDLDSLEEELDELASDKAELQEELDHYKSVGGTTIDEPVFAGMISYRVDNLAMLSLMEEVVRVAKTGKIQLAIDLLKTIR